MKINSALFLLLFGISSLCSAQDTLAFWSFPTGTSADSFPDVALLMNSQMAVRAASVSQPINFGTNGNPTFSAQATGWDNGNGLKYWSVRLLSTGYHTLSLSSEQRAGSTNAGPRDFKAQYRLSPSTVWVDIPDGNVVCNNAWTLGVLHQLPLPVDCNNSTDLLEIRWVMNSDTAINGQLVQSAGVSKIDNILITGFPVTPGLEENTAPVLSCYPQPAKGNVVLHFAAPGENGIIRILALSGQVLKTIPVDRGQTRTETDLSDLTSGLYFISLPGYPTQKLILQK